MISFKLPTLIVMNIKTTSSFGNRDDDDWANTVGEEENDVPRIDEKTLKKLTRQHDGYQTPSLNDKLYLHFQGFRKIEGLTEYIHLKALWLQGNMIERIEGLETCKELKCLYLQDNCLDRIEHLEHLPELDTLNVTNNRITEITGLDVCPSLHTLNIVNNGISSGKSLEGLRNHPNLGVVDLSDNEIPEEDAELVLDIVSSMPRLKVLRLTGNPVLRTKAFSYRRTVIFRCKQLTYLDDRPVFESERLMVEAWGKGETPEERMRLEVAERDRQKREERDKQKRNMAAMAMLIEDARSKILSFVMEEERTGFTHPDLQLWRDRAPLKEAPDTNVDQLYQQAETAIRKEDEGVVYSDSENEEDKNETNEKEEEDEDEREEDVNMPKLEEVEDQEAEMIEATQAQLTKVYITELDVD
ncbi:putative outer arm dynein light chain 1 [Blattamonas nauphoetae]|uniref:Outer arm dynein light chain 1 n=1 Tax=Blattamonas nauphoetae TaxID=2049346 RepID=A0ABQ9Y498_9EUKA|nr:putative outer arm dynein light chain 1 [Blattamonas nauphoetae]